MYGSVKHMGEGDVLHLKSAAIQVIQCCALLMETEGQAVGVQCLGGHAVGAVDFTAAVFAVAQ